MLQPEFSAGGRNRAVIEGVSPEVDAGRFAAKRIAGDPIAIEADIFTDGHDSLSALLCWRRVGEPKWNELPMQPLVNDRWRARIRVPEPCQIEFSIAAWVDAFKTWRRDMQKRIDAATVTDVDYQIGGALIEAAAQRATTFDGDWLNQAAKRVRDIALDPMLEAMMERYPDRRFETKYGRTLRITVDPVKARFSAWYEFFPRSAADDSNRHGTFRDCEARLPYVAELGFDVLYFPPIHPVGTTFRKGRNNTLTPEPTDVGSPWAIGAPEGGHKSIHPALGTIDDFDRLVERAREFNIDIALDIAFQVSPDHPYAKDHVEWFRRRPDGTIQYAENPPKKYQDIYPFDFESDEWESMWQELKSIFDFWIGHGVKIFRVDNPHTKAFPFWEWCIGQVKADNPEVLFLAEAFTRPKVMYRLAKLGFSQSYTYFPWRHAKWELTEYFTELAKPPVSDFFRGNHWPNTPDILTEFLQTNGRAGFLQRFLLVSTIAANYGIYGPAFELLEGRPIAPGSEEYLDSEKYQTRQWYLDKADSLRNTIARINELRRQNPALQNDTSLRFLQVDNDELIAFTKTSIDGSNRVVVVVNLDTGAGHEGLLHLPLEDFGIDAASPYQVHDLLTGSRQIWRGPRNTVSLTSPEAPARIFAIRRRLRTERDFDYFL